MSGAMSELSIKSPCYIAGPMRGFENCNFDSFFRVEAELEQLGVEVVNPARLDVEEGFTPQGDCIGVDEAMLHSMMRRDVLNLVSCESMVMLPMWELSRGASVELSVGLACGLSVFCVSFDDDAVSFDVFDDSQPLSRAGVLSKAIALVDGDRNRTYGDPAEDLGATADMWTAYLGRLRGRALSVADVAAMMVLLKMSRSAASPYLLDHWVDAAGYAAIGGSFAGKPSG